MFGMVPEKNWILDRKNLTQVIIIWAFGAKPHEGRGTEAQCESILQPHQRSASFGTVWHRSVWPRFSSGKSQILDGLEWHIFRILGRFSRTKLSFTRTRSFPWFRRLSLFAQKYTTWVMHKEYRGRTGIVQCAEYEYWWNIRDERREKCAAHVGDESRSWCWKSSKPPLGVVRYESCHPCLEVNVIASERTQHLINSAETLVEQYHHFHCPFWIDLHCERALESQETITVVPVSPFVEFWGCDTKRPWILVACESTISRSTESENYQEFKPRSICQAQQQQLLNQAAASNLFCLVKLQLERWDRFVVQACRVQDNIF